MSGFLLDTKVVWELIKPRPEPRVKEWIDATDESLLFLSVLIRGEIRKEIVKLRSPGRQAILDAWLVSDLGQRFAGRILPIDQGVADRWGRLTGEAASRNQPLPVVDSLLAATALHYDLTLVTRDIKDLVRMHVSVLNPWVD